MLHCNDMTRLTIEVEVGDRWHARMDGCPDWEPRNPLDDPDLAADLEELSGLSYRPLPTDEKGVLSPKAASMASALRALAASVGEHLTSALLSPEAQKRLIAAVHAGSAGTPPLLLLQIRPTANGVEAEHRADRALALPWELLRWEDRFPVEEGTLDLAREAVVDDLPDFSPLDRPLSIVATVASPVDASPFDYEEEMYRLWQAVGEHKQDKRLLVTDLGTLDDLIWAVRHHKPPIIHFTGHGGPGILAFEDEEARSDEVAVRELIRQLRRVGLPRLIFLSACHGTTAGPAPATAASLHRAGFLQVAAYFGPVQDRQATRTAAAFYAFLGTGCTAWEALREARVMAMKPLRDGSGATHVYPLGWVQLALYHRGDGGATALPSAVDEPEVDLPREERLRLFERLDRAGGSQRVEGVVGVQRLRFGFIGRRRERAKAIRKWRQGRRRLIVQGLGGLGKTALCTELAPILAEIVKPGGARILALDGRHAGAQADPILALWQEVQGARSDPGWSQILAGLQKEGVTGEALARAVLALQKIEGGVLVYLDDAESLQVPLGEGDFGTWRNEGLARFWKILVDAAVQESSLGLLVSSRYQSEGTPPEAVLPLPEMSRFEIVRLLAWMPTLGRMPAADRAWVAEQVDGHPRTIEYLESLARIRELTLMPPGESYAGKRWKENILDSALSETQERVDSDLLLGKVWDALSPAIQEHLGRCSVLTASAPWEAIRILETETGTGRRLVEVGLLSPFQAPAGNSSWWAPHSLVTEEAQRRWSGDSRQAHRQLGEWFEAQFTETSASEWAVREWITS
ncbi:MAG TPA: CHAT domain-containing protein [Thermoanaerobaculia bacterium]|nr:CHAT domain-containing protein [Thermoanaerobaculia bacterium]